MPFDLLRESLQEPFRTDALLRARIAVRSGVLTARKPALRRLWTIDRELRARTYPTADRLAALLEVDAKTIRRDLSSLRDDYQAPVAFNREKGGWEYTSDTFRLPAVVITEGELVAMFLAGQTLRQAHGAPYEADLQRAFRKLAEFLPDEISIRWEALEHAQSFHQTVTTLHDIETFRSLAAAVLHRRQLRIRYFTASREAETTRTIDPWHLACVDGDWYLIAWCHARRSRRMFAPGRIRELSETGATFAVPDDFHIADVFDGSFRVVSDADQPLRSVRLRFAPSAAKYVREKVFHASQATRPEPDGGLTLQLSLRSLTEVRRWILSWGSECQVLEPPDLQADIRHEAAAMLGQRPPSQNGERTQANGARRAANREL